MAATCGLRKNSGSVSAPPLESLWEGQSPGGCRDVAALAERGRRRAQVFPVSTKRNQRGQRPRLQHLPVRQPASERSWRPSLIDCDHYVGRLDHGIGSLTRRELEFVNRLVGDRGGDDDASDVDL